MAEGSRGLQAFIDTYQCALINQLTLIHSNTSRTQDRFLVLTLARHTQKYVQCIFLDQDTRMLCEASSGSYGPRAGTVQKFRVSARGLRALAKLGFSLTGGSGNYQLMIEPPASSDYRAVATLILTAIYEVYDAEANSRLRITVPLGIPRDFVPAICVPTS